MQHFSYILLSTDHLVYQKSCAATMSNINSRKKIFFSKRCIREKCLTQIAQNRKNNDILISFIKSNL